MFSKIDIGSSVGWAKLIYEAQHYLSFKIEYLCLNQIKKNWASQAQRQPTEWKDNKLV